MLIRRSLLLAATALLLAPGLAHAADVVAGTPFPTNLLTTPDATQITGLRVDLPTRRSAASCSARTSPATTRRRPS